MKGVILAGGSGQRCVSYGSFGMCVVIFFFYIRAVLSGSFISSNKTTKEVGMRKRGHRFLTLGVLAVLTGSIYYFRTARSTEHPVLYDFVENFPLAEVQQETALIDIGTPAARRYLLYG